MDWYALASLSGQETIAEARLQSVGIETYLPTEYGIKTRFGRQYTALLPYFPNYLFVWSDLDKLMEHLSLWNINRVKTGIISLLTSGKNTPASIDGDFILALKLHLIQRTGFQKSAPPSPRKFATDDLVMGNTGSIWEGKLGRITKMNPNQRCRVLFGLIYAGKTSYLEVEIDELLLSKETVCL